MHESAGSESTLHIVCGCVANVFRRQRLFGRVFLVAALLLHVRQLADDGCTERAKPSGTVIIQGAEC